MPIEPPEIPPATPGHPAEPPPEAPPGSPRPEVPPPVREPGEPPRPEELPGKMPDEMPGRGPQSPPSPATGTAMGNFPAARPDTACRIGEPTATT
ncbi:MAG: hypothetical protein ABI407_17030 [Bradyrhizobium sp.]